MGKKWVFAAHVCAQEGTKGMGAVTERPRMTVPIGDACGSDDMDLLASQWEQQ